MGWATRNTDVIQCGNGICDDPAVRDQSNQDDKVVRMAFHIMCDDQGQTPSGLELPDIERLIQRNKEAFEPYGISFESQIYWDNNSTFFCIPPYSLLPTWRRAIDEMKLYYAVDPSTTLNVFISCQESGESGTLNGIATFPWDPNALTPLGGLWINSQVATKTNQDNNDPVLFHELGHNLGLWHTFHGVDEVDECGQCAENAHGYESFEADYNGDLCSDTPATPKNYDCAPPDAVDCNSVSFGYTDYRNMMGYSRYPSNCRSTFTNQQRKRMHCWLCDSLGSQVISGCLGKQ